MSDKTRRRVGIMGGTFDPIHIGHLILAACADRADGATDEERLEMVSLAIRDNPHFLLDAEEMRRSGFSYTSDTLVALRKQHPDTDYYFIIGADSLLSFDS